jgi:hypothetical protein
VGRRFWQRRDREGTAKGRIEQALGRRREPWVWDTHGIERAIPAPPSFYQPTDTVVGPDGSTYVTDGYGNSRVVKFSRQGNYVKHWGYRGTGPGLFNTPHSIVMDAQQNLYVADRANSRIQVFDTEGTFKTEWRLSEAAGGGGETSRSAEPWSLCITPGPNQVIFAGSVGRVFKLDLNGKMLGMFGKLGRLPGWFDSIHAIACPDEKTVYLAQEFSYRFDKWCSSKLRAEGRARERGNGAPISLSHSIALALAIDAVAPIDARAN